MSTPGAVAAAITTFAACYRPNLRAGLGLDAKAGAANVVSLRSRNGKPDVIVLLPIGRAR